MKNRTEINESSKRDDGYEVGYYYNDLFWFDESLENELLLTSYVESNVKLFTLRSYLFYECGCDTSINTLDLETNINRLNVYNDENYDYWQACLLSLEYIESSLKTLNYLNGKSIKDIKGYSHDIEELVNHLPNNIQKELSVQCLWLSDDYLIENFGPNTMDIDNNIGIRERFIQTGLEKGHYYFKKYLRRIHNGMVDIRYSDVSNLKKDMNLKFLLEMSKSLNEILEREYEPIRHDRDNTFDTINNFNNMLNEYNKGFISPTETKQAGDIPYLPLSDEQLVDTKKSVDAKFKALKTYVIAYNSHSYGPDRNVEIDANPTIDELIMQSELFRNSISKKSGDGDMWKNYSYYQACHLASLYIDHALKYVLLQSRDETYNDLMNTFNHDFKKMYEYLLIDDQTEIRNSCMSLDEEYLLNAVNQKHTKDKIKNNGSIATDDSLFDSMMNLMSESFNQTRYPHSQNYNLEWKYSLRFMLKFADGLNNVIQNKYNPQLDQTGIGQNSRKK